MSRLAGPSCKSILYCSPEQPPPTTATRSTPLGRPCLASRELTLFAALGLSLIRRSSPVRKAGAAVGLVTVFAIIGRPQLNHRKGRRQGRVLSASAVTCFGACVLVVLLLLLVFIGAQV